MICKTYCTASGYQLRKLRKSLQKRYTVEEVMPNVLLLKKANAAAFVFDFGVAVFWNFSEDSANKLLVDLAPFSQGQMDESIEDEFEYVLKKRRDGKVIEEDVIYLSSKFHLEKLAFSYAIAQSIKLAQFEESIYQIVEETRSIPASLAKFGKVNMSHKNIAKLRGEIFLRQSNVNLSFNLMDKPEFFWEYPEYEAIYESSFKYLELKLRIEGLNKKIEVLRGIFDMLADQYHEFYSAKLEWIIIILITVEIAFFLIEEFFKFFG